MQPFFGPVCIVTPDLIGPIANGGIGTSCTALAEFLADGGFDVSLLLTLPESEQRPDTGWRLRYERRGIAIHVLSQQSTPDGKTLAYEPNHPHLIRSLHAYEWLAARTFRIIFFMDWQGAGFHSLSAKALGLAFRDTWLVVHVHSPTVWHSLYSHEPFTQPDQLLTSFLERRSVELADFVLSPTHYMLDWMTGFGWNVARQRVVLPNLVPQGPVGQQQGVRGSGMVRNVVFFGRLERRKGLELFCDAIDRIEASGGQLPAVVFLGKFGKVGGSHSGVYILNRAAGWRTPIRLLCGLDQPGALAWLIENDALAVIPSAMDNAPYTIAECISFGVPFIARATGGVPEMIASEDHERCLVGDNPAELTQKILDAVARPAVCPRLAPWMQEPPARWNTFLASLLRQTPPRPAPDDGNLTPLVSVCIVHKDRPKLLSQAIRSVQLQSYRPIEVILVDDGSVGAEAIALLELLERDFRRLGWRIVRQANRYLGAARNVAAREARGDWILFLDDDNVCKPDQVRTLVGCAQTSGADVLTSPMDVFEGDDEPGPDTRIVERFLPVGGALAYGLFRNGYGDACALYKRSTFEALGGFSEDYGLGCEDYEFFARAALSGAKVMAAPGALFWYRRQKNSMLRATSEIANGLRALRPYISSTNADLREVALTAHGVLAASNMVSATQPLLLALKKAKESLFSCEFQAGFWRSWAMAILSDVVADLDGDDEPSSAKCIQRMALLCICCAHREAASELIECSVGPRNCSNKFNDTANAILLLADGHAFRLDMLPDSITLRAFIAASWYIKMNQSALDTIAGIIAKDSASLPALFIPEIVDAIKARAYVDAADMSIAIMKACEWQYTGAHIDIEQAICNGYFKGGVEHYIKHGHSERRHWAIADAVFSLFPRFPDPTSYFLTCRSMRDPTPHIA
ncbi:MAG: glycosyltransferase [Rhodospirillales bacterium]|nr:glycosyltransferase [Rhodospirillales bacterium]